MIVIADASPLISLAHINKLWLLLDLFDDLLVPETVYAEVSAIGKPFAPQLETFCKPYIARAIDRAKFDELQRLNHGAGESEAIILAMETPNSIILADDLRARKLIVRFELELIGALGILLVAKQRGLIANLKTELDILLANNIRIGAKLYTKILQQAGEAK